MEIYFRSLPVLILFRQATGKREGYMRRSLKLIFQFVN